MSAKIPRLRARAFELQSGRCYYCNLPMWLQSPENFALKYHITLAQAKRFRCTAEHLIPLQNGGSTSPDNIVGACHFCNQKRHKRKIAPSPVGFKLLVAKRLSLHRWHPSWVFDNVMKLYETVASHRINLTPKPLRGLACRAEAP